ncbi:MAG TPA: ankyrin repeat domain-containing protein [Bacilli bacterium]|nr:ankyrin repeat domain-containing protein [Bacilli bacterium]
MIRTPITGLVCLGLAATLFVGCSDKAVPTEQQANAIQQLEAQSIPRTQERFLEAVMQDDAELVRLFLDAGMNPDVTVLDKDGSTPLNIAADHEQMEIVRSLLKEGADPDGKDTVTGHRPLHTAVFHHDTEMAKLLLNHGADPNATLSRGRTPLAVAIAPRPSETVEAHVQLIQLLLDQGADPTESDADGRTALMEAASYGERELVDLLLHQKGVKVNRQDDNGVTALMEAAFQGDPEIVGALLSAGADPLLKDDQRQAAADYARRGDHEEVRMMLLKAGS